jgi:hypothetical protein
MPVFPSAAPTESGPVQVMAKWSTGQARVPLRGAGGGAVGLLRAGAGVTLTGRLNLPGAYWYRVGEDPIPTYTFAGGYTVSAEAIGTPLRVQERPADARGTREYSAMPLYGLEFVNPLEPYYFAHWAAGALTWRFIIGTNVADDGSGEVGFVNVSKCAFQRVCHYAPEWPGRMLVGAWVEGQYVEMASSRAAPQVDSLELKCNDSKDSIRITRADNVRCVVTGTTDVVGWDYVAEGTSYRNPAAGANPFKGLVWEGKVVVGGTVTVRARTSDSVESKSVSVGVAARSWSGMTMPRIIAEQPNDHLPARPDSVHHLGDIHQVMQLYLSRDKWEPILSGPNANLAYLVKVPAEYEAIVHVNRVALSVGSDFWNAQYKRQRSSGVVDCLQREVDVPGFIPEILRHEGIGFDPKSHAYLYVSEAERVGNPGWEQVVGATLQDLADRSETVLTTAHQSAKRASTRADSSGFAPRWCRFHFNY